MIARDLAPLLRRAAATTPVVTLTGPRRSGKTTLCRALFPGHAYRTLEGPDARAFALDDPRSFLGELPEGAVIDEIQRAPDLLSHLQGIVDDDPAPGRWILAGSQDRLLLESIGQSLAGRTELHELLPLTWGEIRRFAHPPASLDEALFTGGYPRILDHALDPTAWLRAYIGTYLARGRSNNPETSATSRGFSDSLDRARAARANSSTTLRLPTTVAYPGRRPSSGSMSSRRASSSSVCPRSTATSASVS